MRASVIQISLILIILGVASCYPPPEFPIVPDVSFERLRLTDTATLVLTFHVRDGDGDIGLASESEDVNDLLEPYHSFSAIVSGNDIVTFSDGLTGPYNIIPVIKYPFTFRLYKGTNASNQPVYENRTVQILYAAGEEVVYSNDDLRPVDFDCNYYEVVSFYSVEDVKVGGQVISQNLIEEVDTIFIERNPFHYNVFIELQLKNGNDYIPFELDECDPGYTARFPIFKRSNIGRPLDGSISYAFFSVLFQDPESSPLLTATMRLKFYIYDRALNKSNEVITPDFKILNLRQGDLVSD